jgi:SAM-dependent methyltransferase
MSDRLLARVKDYYQEKVRTHGATARGVDWSSEESQELRFRELARALPADGSISVLDYGCGYGALLGYLRNLRPGVRYQGYDISEAMVSEARSRWHGVGDATFTDRANELLAADYVLASGIFNVRLEATDDEWTTLMLETIERLATLAVHGLAFNVLSLYSDPPRRRPDLYYADPLALFDHCKRRLSPHVALFHDYPLYEFTMVVRK